jgi:hypothetical protein
MGRVVIVFAVAVVAVLIAFWVVPPFGTLGVSQ